ncbi:putative B3 domain-containing protein Os04g0347400 [Typha angustifolia]|uniref:putative B3 domain-containing protein Os04g0347400 n=1 Tax=Typha angustifolia TaxID=59011 RepID=UPI003C2C4411
MATSSSGRSQRPQFFKVLLPRCLGKLKIPPKFAVHLSNDNIVDGQKANILGPLGKVWQVELLKEGSGLFFGSGWKEFVRAYELLVGYFLVFRYEGNMIFTIKVFDLTGCRKEYKNLSSFDQEEAAEENIVPSKRKRKSEKKEVRKEGIRKEESSSCNKSRPRLERTIRTYNRAYVNIPKQFCSSVGLSTTREIVLKNSTQKSWQVSFGMYENYNFLGKGWREFSKDNNIKIGDRCIFELVQENVFCVRVVKDL